MTPIEKAIRDFCGHHADWWPSTTQVQEMLALAQPEKEPLEYWNAVEGWVKIDEVREHFDSVGCGTIYKTAGEDRVPVYIAPPPCPTLAQSEQDCVGWFGYDTGLRLWFEANKGDDGAIPLYKARGTT